MVTVGLMVRIEAKPDKVEEVEAMLHRALAVIQEEETTPLWMALRLGPTTFGVFDAFANDADRQAHLDAHGDALRNAAPALFTETPSIDRVGVVAAKLPGK
jgi:quinol monooxygenase YgiN